MRSMSKWALSAFTILVGILVLQLILSCFERDFLQSHQSYLLIATVVSGLFVLWLRREEGGLNGRRTGCEHEEARRERKLGRKSRRMDRIPVVGWFVRWMREEGWPCSILLLLALLGCFIVRFYFASVSNIYSDEGNGLYDANLILEGETPFKDYLTRAPGYMYTLAFSIEIFGYNIMAGRILAIVASVVVCLFIFKIGKELYNRDVGLAAALVYCVSPFFVYWDTIGYLRTASFVWVPIAVYFLIVAVRRNDIRYYFLYGLFVGIAILFYRGHLLYIMLCPLVLLFVQPREAKSLSRSIVVALFGFCIPVIPALLYFILQTDIQWILSQYGVPGYISTTASTGTMGDPTISYSLAKSRVLYVLFAYGIYLFIPALVFLTLLLRKLVENTKLYVVSAVLAWILVLSVGLGGRYVGYHSWGLAGPPDTYTPILFCLLGLVALVSILLLTISKLNLNLKPNLNFANTFLILWFLCASAYFIMSPVRSEIGAVPAVIMSAIAILVVFRHRKELRGGILSAAFLILLILSAVFAGFVYIDAPLPERTLEMSTAREVGAYINEHTSPGDEILTGSPIFAVESDRRIIFDISHPMIYGNGSDDPTRGYDPYDIVPSIREMIEYLEFHEVRYIVADSRTHSLFISERHPDLRDYIIRNYIKVRSVDDVTIYARKGG